MTKAVTAGSGAPSLLAQIGQTAAPALAALQFVRTTAEDVMASLRSCTRGLRPPALDELGAVTCIRRLLADVEARSGIKGELMVFGHARRLPAEQEMGLYRITQEAVHNVERHAQATTVQITLLYTAESVQLTVADNGRGFALAPAPADAAASESLGLLGMQERASLLGGRLDLQTWSGAGTRVVATIPC